MVFPSATAVAALVMSFAVASPLAARTAPRGVSGSAAATMKLAAGLWAPPKKSKPRPARDDDKREEELLRSPRKPAAGEGAPKKRRPIKMDGSQEESEDEAAEAEEGEGDDEGDEDKPKVTKHRKRVVEEEEEDDDEAAEPISSQPSVIPRLINFGIATAVMRRSFAFDQASLQGDAGFRIGYQLALESFPLVTQPNGWYRTLGVGAWYEKEYGDATHDLADGMFNGYPFSQSRWGFDVRYAIPAGDWVIVMPALGYGRMGADLQRTTPTTPTNCVAATAIDPCFGDVNVSYLSIDVHLRVGLTPTLALSLSGGFLYGLGVASGPDQITAEGSASMKGFHVDAGATMLLGSWFAVNAAIPFRRYGFSYDAPPSTTFTYRSAADTYYGLIAGIAVLTK